MLIGVISDTHGRLDPAVEELFAGVDHIVHAGDVGDEAGFGNDWRNYFYFQDRKYWHMGDPYSSDPEEQPNVINRTWVDVRRHEENVRYGSWTDEEIELQKRIWEIQLEKTTVRPKPET